MCTYRIIIIHTCAENYIPSGTGNQVQSSCTQSFHFSNMNYLLISSLLFIWDNVLGCSRATSSYLCSGVTSDGTGDGMEPFTCVEPTELSLQS